MHTLTFYYPDSDGQITVSIATWEILHLEPELEEIRISDGRDSVEVVLGYGSLGRFIYVPEFSFGFQVDDLSDAEHSTRRLCTSMCQRKAATIAFALRDYSMC